MFKAGQEHAVAQTLLTAGHLSPVCSLRNNQLTPMELDFVIEVGYRYMPLSAYG